MNRVESSIAVELMVAGNFVSPPLQKPSFYFHSPFAKLVHLPSSVPIVTSVTSYCLQCWVTTHKAAITAAVFDYGCRTVDVW